MPKKPKGKLRAVKHHKVHKVNFEVAPGIHHVVAVDLDRYMLHQPKSMPRRYALESLSSKNVTVKYRDRKTGHFVSPSKLNGKRFVKPELYRYSRSTRSSKKIVSRHLKAQWLKRKRPMSLHQEKMFADKFYSSIGITTFIHNNRLYAATGSP